jgi:hypothetical protein
MQQQLNVASALSSLPPAPTIGPASLAVPTAAPPGQLMTPAPYIDASDNLLFDPDTVDALPKIRADVGGQPLEQLDFRKTSDMANSNSKTIIDMTNSNSFDMGMYSANSDNGAKNGMFGGLTGWILPVALVIILILCSVLVYMLSKNKTPPSSGMDSLGLAPGLGPSTYGGY